MKYCLVIVLGILTSVCFTQKDFGQIHGNIQTDVQYYRQDSLIGAPDVPEKMLMNGYANINYTRDDFSAGIRYESYLNALQGFPAGYQGTGIPYRYARYKAGELDVTVGNYYEQFGSGMIFRSYQERGLGYDNAMDGFNVKYKPTNGVYLKGVYGVQRLFFGKGEGIVRGIDGEVVLNELTDSLAKKMKTRVILGGSFVSKYQKDDDQTYILPENVGSYAGRINIYHGNFFISGEYVEKINDPSIDNGFIYKKGQALLINTSYSKKGLGISFSAKTIDNMSFRSDRKAELTNLLINYLPATTKQHTYNLPATLYPYAVQTNGEVSFQGEVSYKIKKKSLLGGKYGTQITANLSSNFGLDSTKIENDSSRMGYKTKFFSPGKEVYFTDFNIEIRKKISKKVKLAYSYFNIRYNKEVVEGKIGNGLVNASIHVLDVSYKIKSKHTVRVEAQHLRTVKTGGYYKDQGNWVTGLIEYTISPHWSFAVLDQYNYGNEDAEKQIHYLFGSVGYTKKANRFMLSYCRQRAGIFCVGGVCRNVPASNGVTFTITSSF
jgi:hypothetical protein